MCSSLFLIWSITLLKRDSSTGVSLWLMQNFWEQLFWKISPISANASENLSGAAILIFRRYFRSSSLSAFYKIDVLKKTALWVFFNEFRKIFILRTYFLQDSSRQLLLIFRKLVIQTFNSKQMFLFDQYYWCTIFDHALNE